MYRFLIVLEKANGNYSAYSPDLAGCIATGATREEAEKICMKLLKCIFVDYWRTNCQFLNLILLQNMLLFSKDFWSLPLTGNGIKRRLIIKMNSKWHRRKSLCLFCFENCDT